MIPIHITPDWNIITRTILPVVWNPDLSPVPTVPVGTAPTTFSAFLSPKNPTNGWLWGVGPVIQIPTISSATLGSSVWGGGPTAVLVYLHGPIVAGALANNVWSFGGTHGPGGNSYNNFLTQPFVNYNFGDGWYVGSSPIITADWQANGTKWTVPIGADAGRVYEPVHDDGRTWRQAIAEDFAEFRKVGLVKEGRPARFQASDRGRAGADRLVEVARPRSQR